MLTNEELELLIKAADNNPEFKVGVLREKIQVMLASDDPRDISALLLMLDTTPVHATLRVLPKLLAQLTPLRDKIEAKLKEKKRAAEPAAAAAAPEADQVLAADEKSARKKGKSA